MKKKLTLLILLLPFVVFAQTGMKDGTITIDFGKKDKNSQQTQPVDTPQEKPFVYPSDEEAMEEREARKPKKRKTTMPNQEDFDFRRDGLFKGLFNVGLNACQVDGDVQAGYNYLGFHGGVGVMVRYHRFLSTSIEINYSMKGAKQRIVPNQNPAAGQLYSLQLDYIDLPISLLNVHDKKLIMFSIGLTPAILVRYKEINSAGLNVTNDAFTRVPARFDLQGFAGFGFVIKQQFYLGGKFSYSFIKMRPALSGTKTNGQYNNVITFKFMYILGQLKKKK
ncbi:MAG TPA: outer membrane beta-barrel protein [Chitinophagales bacterium]|nr:outer membrane beta-barrel protein [Chitinophagales bacterium]